MLFVDNKDSVLCILNPKKKKQQQQNRYQLVPAIPIMRYHSPSPRQELKGATPTARGQDIKSYDKVCFSGLIVILLPVTGNWFLPRWEKMTLPSSCPRFCRK